MNSGLADIFFIGDARDYHAMDWYRTVKEICGSRKVVFVTDLKHSEGCEQLVKDGDNIIDLLNIDSLLLSRQSRYGNLWRNFVKLAASPVQARRLRAIAQNSPDSVFHAHTMYYMVLCWLAGIRCIGTPQGSEILVRPGKSRLYKHFAVRALRAARHVTVDSVNMRQRILELSGRESTIIQNGIDIPAILRVVGEGGPREKVVSLRGFTPLYRIAEIFEARQCSPQKPRLHFIYPFQEEVYKAKVAKEFQEGDRDLGRLSKMEMYQLLVSSKLAISIPRSDSSPRSVYEAIFCGCCVAVTDNPWIEALPACMKARLFIADLGDDQWLEKALDHADALTRVPYIPSGAALHLFDQRKSMERVVAKLY